MNNKKMFNMNSGYHGFSMSKRAVMAYKNGEMPISKWTKSVLIDEVRKLMCNEKVNFSIDVLKKAPKCVLEDLVLYKSSKHHTSKFCNSTDFYSLDFVKLRMLTDDMIHKKIEAYKKEKYETRGEINNRKKYRGNIKYIEWEGNYPNMKASKKKLYDVIIEETKSSYIIMDDEGNVILRKRINSKGTYVTKYDKVRKKSIEERL